MEQSVELARQEGVVSRSVRLSISPAGGIVLDAQDMGPNVKRTWDDGDYEFWVTVPPSALAKLAFELLKDKFTGEINAVDAFRAYCTARGIAHEFESWA